MRGWLAVAMRAAGRWSAAAWQWAVRKPSQAGRFVYNHAIGVFLVVWGFASVIAVIGIMYLADPCRGTTLVCPGVEWIRPGYLAEDFRNLLWAASLVFGGAGAGAALINALRRTRLMHAEHALKRSGQDAETFSRAVEQLGSKETAIRLGAIYALEGLMRTAFADGGDHAFGRQIGETLAAFVRDQSVEEARTEAKKARNEAEKAKATAEATKSDSATGTVKPPSPAATKPKNEHQLRLAADREAAVVVLARSWPFEFRPNLEGEGGVDLSGAQLAFLKLPQGTDLRQFDFSEANLSDAQLSKCNLSNGRLFQASLVWAHLDKANLKRAAFTEANLQGATLSDAQMEGVKLLGANLESAEIINTNLSYSWLFGAKFVKVRLIGTNMRGSWLIGASFRDADLEEVQITGADISSASFTSHFGERPIRNLTTEQLSEARWNPDKPPRFYPEIGLPHRGDGKPSDDTSPFDSSWIRDPSEVNDY
ncbi:MAG: Pentapeptide repeat family protein [Oceanicaulis sp. HLUCCA04]|nr:MAG: Pentapeptide repeat family protein [Oceanicaulis sp. HLUCCA04]